MFLESGKLELCLFYFLMKFTWIQYAASTVGGGGEKSIELGVLRLMSNMQSFLGPLLTLALFFLEAPALFLLATSNASAELLDLDVPTSHMGTRFKHRCWFRKSGAAESCISDKHQARPLLTAHARTISERSKAPGLRQLAKALLDRESLYRGPTTHKKVDVCTDCFFCPHTKQAFKWCFPWFAH